jgi:hypothetical protein
VCRIASAEAPLRSDRRQKAFPPAVPRASNVDIAPLLIGSACPRTTDS